MKTLFIKAFLIVALVSSAERHSAATSIALLLVDSLFVKQKFRHVIQPRFYLSPTWHLFR